MFHLSRTGLLPALCLAGIFGVTGCATTEPAPTTPTPMTDVSGKQSSEPTVKPAPAPTLTATSADGKTHVLFAFPNGDEESALATLDKSLPSQVAVGQPFDITYTLVNKSKTLCLEEIVVSDTLPAGFKVASTTPNAASTDGSVKWNVARVDPGQTATFKLTGSATAPGNLSSCAAMTAVPRACSTIAVVAPALKLAKTMTPAVIICDPITATYTVSNTGTGATTNVVIADPLPDGLVTTDGKDSLSIPVGTLAPGQSRAFSASLKASRTGKYDNTAVATADGNLKSEASASTTVTAPVLQVACTGTPKTFIGRQFTHEFTVTNTGDAASKGTVVTVTTPAGATVANAGNGQVAAGSVKYALPDLAPKGTGKVSVTYTAAAEGSFTSNVSVAGVCAPAVTCKTTTSVTGIPALLLNGSDNPDPIQVGQNVTYTLTVTNQGTAPLTNVKLVCTGEAATMQIVSTTGGTATVDGVKVTFAPIPTLAPKAEQTYTVVVKATKAGQVQLSAESSSDQITRPLLKTETTNFYE